MKKSVNQHFEGFFFLKFVCLLSQFKFFKLFTHIFMMEITFLYSDV